VENKESPELLLILGCFGLIEEGFTHCSSCENKILKINQSIQNYSNLIEYLDSCRLFDKPLYDMNGVKNVIQNIHVKFNLNNFKKLWHQKEIDNYEKFISSHKRCGLYLKLILEETQIKQETTEVIENIQNNEENVIFIPNNKRKKW
jgi:hypothetical protein